jgi:hypothetical protein
MNTAALAGYKLEAALVDYLATILGQPFQWGTMDCNTVALGWLDTLAGTAELAQVRGRYTDQETARQFQLEHGRTLRAVLIEAGAELVAKGPAFAQPGDFLVVDTAGEPWTAGCVCSGWGFVSMDTNKGGILLPMETTPEGTELWRCSPWAK